MVWIEEGKEVFLNINKLLSSVDVIIIVLVWIGNKSDIFEHLLFAIFSRYNYDCMVWIEEGKEVFLNINKLLSSVDVRSRLN